MKHNIFHTASGYYFGFPTFQVKDTYHLILNHESRAHCFDVLIFFTFMDVEALITCLSPKNYWY